MFADDILENHLVRKSINQLISLNSHSQLL